MPMLPQFNHDLMTSVRLWLANKLENEGQAYINTTGTLYPTEDSSVRGNMYTSPYRGWVYDSCVAGATIPSGVSTVSGQFLTRASGVVIDWDHGQVITQQKWGTLNAAYARKQVNVYFSDLRETDYILEQVLNANTNLQYTVTGFSPSPGMGNHTLTAPMVILTNSQGNNAPFALGGIDNTRSTVRAFIVTNSNWLQEGVGSLIRDAAHETIPFGSYADWPLAGSGDLKGATFDYCTGFAGKWGCQNGAYIENVYDVRVNEWTNGNTTFFLSILELDLSKIRL